VIIPVRVPADAKPVLASERRMAMQSDHPLYGHPCPVCDRDLGGEVTVLVFAGIDPEDRKPSGWSTGEAVAVHAACAGVPEEEPETPPRTVTYDVSGADALHVLTQALEDYADKAAVMASREDASESFTRWAAIAGRMKAQAEAAAG
jgi:hypothetical protein